MKINYLVESGWDGVFIIVKAVNKAELGEKMKQTKLPFKWNTQWQGYEVKYPECVKAIENVFGKIPEEVLDDAKELFELENKYPFLRD